MSDALKEALKSFARLAVLTLATLLVDFVLEQLTKGTIPISPEIVGVISILLSAVDKYLHEKQNEGVKSGDRTAGGLLPF